MKFQRRYYYKGTFENVYYDYAMGYAKISGLKMEGECITYHLYDDIPDSLLKHNML